MKSVLISIQPKWCELIASGKKTVEARKTRPKIDTLFKCYIYCTLSGSNEFFKEDCRGDIAEWNKSKMALKKGKVIGEFICDEIINAIDIGGNDFYAKSCMSLEEWLKYTDNHKGKMWCWHITDLVIYEKPKELGEFKTFCKEYFDGNRCEDCEYFIDGRGFEYDESDCGCDGLKPLKRPPQSWCYVYETEKRGVH